jgi:hypothetical protein
MGRRGGGGRSETCFVLRIVLHHTPRLTHRTTHYHIAPNKRQRAAAAERGGQQLSAPAAAERENSRLVKGRSSSRSRSSSSRNIPSPPRFISLQMVPPRCFPPMDPSPSGHPPRSLRSLRSLSSELRFSGPLSRVRPLFPPSHRISAAPVGARPMVSPRTIVDRHRGAASHGWGPSSAPAPPTPPPQLPHQCGLPRSRRSPPLHLPAARPAVPLVSRALDHLHFPGPSSFRSTRRSLPKSPRRSDVHKRPYPYLRFPGVPEQLLPLIATHTANTRTTHPDPTSSCRAPPTPTPPFPAADPPPHTHPPTPIRGSLAPQNSKLKTHPRSPSPCA